MKSIYIGKSISGLLLLAASWSAFSQQPITLSLALGKALSQHPDLQRFAHQAKIAQGQVTQAGIATPMQLNVDVENVLGSGNYQGLSAAESTLTISWLLENELIDSRVKLAQESTHLAKYQRQAKALDVAANTATIFVTLLVKKERLTLAELALAQAEKSLLEVTKRVNAGRSNVVDKLRAQAHLANKQLLVEDLKHEIIASREQLAAQWRGNSDISISGKLSNIPSVQAVESAYQKLSNHPRLKLLTVQQRIAQSAIALAKAKEQPTWQLNAGVKRNEALDDVGFTFGVSIPLGSAGRNQGGIIALKAEQAQQKTEAEAWQLSVSTQLLLLTHKLNHNYHVIEGLSNEIIPTLTSANQSAEAAYLKGNYSYTDWYAVQHELNDAQSALISAYSNIHLFNIELERLTGASISH
ncbi:MAG: TolC family protein [Thalassotalea sp.]